MPSFTRSSRLLECCILRANTETSAESPNTHSTSHCQELELLEEAGDQWLEVINKCLREGAFPRICREATIAWISKPGNEGLRPICLLPITEKVLDEVLTSRLTHHLMKRGRISDRQFDFRRSRGTINAIEYPRGIRRYIWVPGKPVQSHIQLP